ncbi:hypothetical protein KRM28CT15_52620 [Krasilnikovia sp. M28-CT-15]
MAALLLTGCDGGSTPKQDNGGETLEVKTQADVEKVVTALAESVAAEVGSPLQKMNFHPVLCDNAIGAPNTDGVWSLSGIASVAVKPTDQVPMITRLRDKWTELGYEITEFRMFPPDNQRGTVSARIPSNDLSISLQSTAPGTGFAITIGTPCYKPAPGENPGN